MEAQSNSPCHQESKQHNKTKQTRFVFIGGFSLLAVIVIIILLSLGGPKSEREIIADLPGSITTLSLNGELIQLDVESLKIDKRKTQDGTDDVYCVIELTSDAIAVTSYQHLIYTKYNGNQWVLDHYVPFETAQIRLLEAPDSLYNWAVSEIESEDDRFTDLENSITDCAVTVNNREARYVFDIRKDIGLMHIGGQISLDCLLSGNPSEGYYWSGSPDFSSVDISWDVDGTWQGHITNFGLGWYELTLDIDSLTTESVSCTWSYDHNGDYYSGDSSDCQISDSSDEAITFTIWYASGLGTYVKVTFFIDGTCEITIPALGSCLMERIGN